jgi:methionine aminopeptidase
VSVFVKFIDIRPLKFIHANILKSDLGCHVDGFIAVAAHTFVVGASKVSNALF